MKTTKLILFVFALIITIQISRTSLGWAIITGAFSFAVLCWLNNEPEQHEKRTQRDNRIAQEARGQRELINEGGKK